MTPSKSAPQTLMILTATGVGILTFNLWDISPSETIATAIQCQPLTYPSGRAFT